MTQDISKTTTGSEKKEESSNGEQQRQKEKREKNTPPTKVVIRRLPPSMTEETFLDQISPLPKFDYMYFVKADMSLGQHGFSRAYINFVCQEDIFIFKDKFDGYVFVDQKGNEYPAVVEFAPFQKIPKKKVKKKDTKCGTIEQDPDYIKFLESLQNPEEVTLPSVELYLEEIENRERDLRANSGSQQPSTPLIEYLNQKKAEKQRIREEKREERKRRELEKKRQKEEDRKRRRSEKEKEREKAKEKNKDGKEKEKDKSSEDKGVKEPSVKLLRNPEREKKESDKESVEREIVKSSNVIGDSSATHDKPRRETCEKPSRSSISGNKDWEDRRRRDDDKPKHRDKPRDRRDSEKFKRDRDEIGKTTGRSNYNRNNTENSSGYKDDSHSRSSQSSRSSDWHHDKSERCPMKSHVSSSHAVSTGAKTGDRGTRGGKSYEKSRESIAKARNESKTSIVPKSSEHLEAQSSGLSKEDKKNAEFQVDSSLPVGGFEKESSTSVDREDSDCVKAVDDKYVSEDYEKFVDDADENIQEGKRHKENGNSRDPRSERRIRNKDRPSIELYRPGMRRLSLQRNSPQKESPSSSSSPSPTAQMLGKHLRSDNGKCNSSHQSVDSNSPNTDLEVKEQLNDTLRASEDDQGSVTGEVVSADGM